MIFDCKLIDMCLDCPNSHIDVHNEIAKPSGNITPQVIKSTLYCKHMAVCKDYLGRKEGSQVILVPLGTFLDENIHDYGDVEYNAEYEGDGINE